MKCDVDELYNIVERWTTPKNNDAEMKKTCEFPKENAAIKTKLQELRLYMQKQHAGCRCRETWTKMEQLRAPQFVH